MNGKKEKKIKRPSRIALCFVSILLAILIVINVVMIGVVSPYFGIVNNFLASSPDTEEAATAKQASADMTQKVEEEGVVLLTNNGTLPLQNNTKINVFGSGTVNFTYGGTGSGSGDSSSNVSFIQGLKNAGLEVNEELQEFTEQKTVVREKYNLLGNDFNLFEIPVSEYSNDLISAAKNYSNVAVVCFSRMGGEGYDIPLDMAEYDYGDSGKSYLELQQSELDLLELAKNNFENVIVVLNSPNSMELGFLNDEKVDASLWVGCPGSTGCNAIGDIITGMVNPSGRTADTFAYQVESAPTYYNFGSYDYTNVSYVNDAMFAGTSTVGVTGNDNYHYVEYVEGIYVGYRYYETAAADGYIDYDKTVQFPFGYGLSYTTFDENISNFTNDGTTITMQITVKNTGDVAGKDVVELYYTPPYYEGGIEKSQVVLGGFAKTERLEPGASQEVTISLNYEDMASYDYSGIKADGGAYVLESGNYEICLQSNSHTKIDSRTVTVDRDYIYNKDNDGARSTDEVIATNQFDDVSFGDDLVYVSRADWKGTMPTERAQETKEATTAQVTALTAEPTFDDSETEDITFKNHGLSLSDMAGLDYDDPLWNDLLEQISVNEMKLLIGNGGWATMQVKSVDKPYLSECDGPNGVNNIMAGINGNQYTGQSVLGLTWNTDLSVQMGKTFGEEAVAYGIAGLYAPALNIHRSPFSGRNYEYISEDGYLTGAIAAAEIQGIQSNGVYCYTKHFALNDQESNRDQGGLCTWANEQAMREIYLRAFELAVKDGKTLGIMSSFNRLGTTPAAESYPLLTTVLREEWGFHGGVITDCVMAVTTQDINVSLRAGNDLQLSYLAQGRMSSETTDTPAGRQVMRRASHNILYMVANSSALKNAEGGPYGWVIGLILVDILLFALFALYYVKRHAKMKRWKVSLTIVNNSVSGDDTAK